MAGERSQALARRAGRPAGRRPDARRAGSVREHLRLPAIKPSTRAELSRRLRLAADYIESHYDQPLPLEALAQVACMSTFHFVRYFALLHGVTPHAYLVNRRTAAARRMLAEGFTDLTLIAERSGFGSRSSLYRALTRGAATAGSRRGGAARR